jgi:hypothetical protein
MCQFKLCNKSLYQASGITCSRVVSANQRHRMLPASFGAVRLCGVTVFSRGRAASFPVLSVLSSVNRKIEDLKIRMEQNVSKLFF